MLNIIVTLKCGLEVTQGHWNWCHSKAWVRFSNSHGRICSRLWDIQRQRMVWPWKQGKDSFKVIGNDTSW